MAAGEWNGFEDGDLEMDFGGAKFNVHRAIIAQASPVWKAMLTGTFADSPGTEVHFDGDGPQVARLCVEVIYSTFTHSTLDWASVESRVESDRGAFDAFVEKYDLRGVKHLIMEYELDTRQEMRKLKSDHVRSMAKLEREHGEQVEMFTEEVSTLGKEVKRLEGQVKKLAIMPGTLVNLDAHVPDIGTRVKRKITEIELTKRNQWYKYTAMATITAIDGYCITVRWKKGGGVRTYDLTQECFEYI